MEDLDVILLNVQGARQMPPMKKKIDMTGSEAFLSGISARGIMFEADFFLGRGWCLGVC